MSIRDLEEQIVGEFMVFDDWMDKYNHIIEMGKDLPKIEDKFKIDNNLIPGCQSRVWLHAGFEEGKVFFYADSDANPLPKNKQDSNL